MKKFMGVYFSQDGRIFWGTGNKHREVVKTLRHLSGDKVKAANVIFYKFAKKGR